MVFVNPAFTGPAGSDPDGTGPATAIGYDAFATIQAALNAVASSGTVTSRPAPTARPSTLSRSVILVGTTQVENAGTGQLNLTTAGGVAITGLTVHGYALGLAAGSATTSPGPDRRPPER